MSMLTGSFCLRTISNFDLVKETATDVPLDVIESNDDVYDGDDDRYLWMLDSLNLLVVIIILS